jgi:hypothetical protein
MNILLISCKRIQDRSIVFNKHTTHAIPAIPIDPCHLTGSFRSEGERGYSPLLDTGLDYPGCINTIDLSCILLQLIKRIFILIKGIGKYDSTKTYAQTQYIDQSVNPVPFKTPVDYFQIAADHNANLI